MKSFKQEKSFYTIKEVAERFQVKPSLLRYWEKEFGNFIQPQKTKTGIRQYTNKDIEAIGLAYHLIKEKGLTLAGAKQKLKDNKASVIQTEEVVRRLKSVQDELLALKNEIEEMEKHLS